MNLDDFTYPLPQEKIAEYPLTKRDDAKLLVYQQGKIEHAQFNNLHNFLTADSLLVFNDTKVIPARLLFQKETGAVIEIFLLEPVSPSTLLVQAMAATSGTTWQCIIGNVKRWKDGTSLSMSENGITFNVQLLNRSENLVELTWSPPYLTFAEAIAKVGATPLPPYIKRKAEKSDEARYQTIYSHYEGAVAAPTAGLHFTEEVFASLHKKNIQKEFVTLHVSAGTFQPIKSTDVLNHEMHHEQIVINRSTIEKLMHHEGKITCVGTTCVRTLESLYWFGRKLMENKSEMVFSISQNEPYELAWNPYGSKKSSLEAVLQFLEKNKTETLIGYTSIFIHPGYQFKMCDALITNFHQPGSTLILLVAAFIGDDWRKVYEEALSNNYRFLSYGDSSLLIP
ncbi:MAG: S-adenosylmethionine:tRNA ribosyltransferase-isomerase [Flammeovirgaceae bacterium]|nr:S-adenosylmethionine:tRNA ribosyltransferase-isomerase [Flammeovirgaceae bacterium]